MEASATPILEISVVLLLAAGAGWLARRLTLPAVLGYLAVGLAISPFTPGYVADREQLQLFADVGVVLLLFEVGIEVDVGHLRREHTGILWAAPLQTLLTTVIAGVVFAALGIPFPASGLLGLCVALSSSVVIANITRSRRRTTDEETEHVMLGWSVLQDLTGVGLGLILLAILAPGERDVGLALASVLGYVVVVLIAVRLLPVILRAVQDQNDLFMVLSVGTGLALAAAGSAVFGVPLALAAFIAGLAVTESDQAARARSSLLPFRDLFALLFFVAVGTLVDPGALRGGLGWLALLIGLVAVAKSGLAWALARSARLQVRRAQLAVGIGQMGEFSFVLASLAAAASAISAEVYVAVVAAVAVTIGASTVVVRWFRPIPVEATP